MKKNTFNKFLNVIYLVLLFFLLNISLVVTSLLAWFKDTFGVSFTEIIYTLKSPLVGADTDFLGEAIKRSLVSFLLTGLFFVLGILIIRIRQTVSVTFKLGRKIRINLLSFLLIIMLVFPAVYSYITLQDADNTLKFTEYIRNMTTSTKIYDDYYVFPDSVSISTSSKKNLIYIFIESMETTYASEEAGGKQPTNNYIPALTKYAQEEISFSNSDKLGGFHCNIKASWTASALFCCQSGIPFSFPIRGNEDFGNRESFASGTTMLGDILEKEGYYQEFLCGSDASFGGRKALFQQHGNYNIYDLYTAINAGYLKEEDQVWWGLEDKTLYTIAKDELTRISKLNQPFNLTMLTVDTHHVDGWVCDLCPDDYPDQLANVVKCADNQIYEFVEWCKTQPWYDNTVIVIQGDHPRMDTSLVANVDFYDRTIYNCFINTGYDSNSLSLSNREFASIDIFPTVLGAMGYNIEGDRLGLGTNLFSEKQTLCEELGFEYVNSELGKSSRFFERYFY